MILSFSHNKIWTDKGPVDTNHKPYFLLHDNGKEIPKLDKVIEISEPIEMESWVNWDTKIKVRKIYIEHPSITPKVSSEYYKLGYETFEQAVPYLSRVAADLEASGDWPFLGDWTEIKCLIYDIEELEDKDLISCIGFGEFKIKIKGYVNLETEDFQMDIEIPEKCEISQITCDRREAQFYEIYKPFVEKVKNADIIIGHNIVEFDNLHLYDRLSSFDEFKQFLKERTYEHEGFQRGRHSKRMVEIYPMSFDTLHAARFIWKGESDVGYGLKQLAIKHKLSPPNRKYERDFGGFGNWDNNNPICLEYNQHDIVETFGLFKLLAQPILINMFISGLSFQDVVSGSNGRLADNMCLVRGHDKIINPPMQHPSKIAKALQGHFNGELKTKKEIFEFFRTHMCNWDCIAKFKAEVNTLSEEEDEDEDFATDGDTPQRLHDKLIRVVKYGEEMPDYVEYYPLLYSPYSKDEQKKDKTKRCYIAVGGKTIDPTEPMVPAHDVWKGDTAAQYPTIEKAKWLTSDVIKLSRKGEKVDGWCWFRVIYNKHILNLFEWRPASEFPQSDGEGYFIGYRQRGREGLLGHALTGIIKAVGVYKKKPGWDEAYQKTLKPMRNALTHGVMLALDATCQQYNIAGCAIPTYGQEITTQMNNHLEQNGWKILETDTDGTEFRKEKSDAPDFVGLVEDVEKYWTERFNYPFVFDKEHSKHKLFFAAKNYITIKDNDEVKLTGNTLHAADKPKIAEKCMKALALEIIPKANTKKELLMLVHKRASSIVNKAFKDIDVKDLVIISGVKPPQYYDTETYRERAEAIQDILHRLIVPPGTRMEFLVCEDRLPGTHGEKTLSDPISYMWPKDYAIENNKKIDISWAKEMVFSYIDTPFGFDKVSSKHHIEPLFGFKEDKEETLVHVEHNESKQKGLDAFDNKELKEDDKKIEKSKQEKLF